MVVRAPPPGHLTGSQGSIVLQPRTANSLHVSKPSSDTSRTPARSESQPSIHNEGGAQSEEAVSPDVLVETHGSLESTRTPPCVDTKDGTKHSTPKERHSESLNDRWETPPAAKVQKGCRDGISMKRRRDQEDPPSAPRSSCYGLDPVVVQRSKPWPVFTIACSRATQTEQHLSEVDRYEKMKCPPSKPVFMRVPCATQAEEDTGEDGRPAVQPGEGEGQAGAGWSRCSVGGGGRGSVHTCVSSPTAFDFSLRLFWSRSSREWSCSCASSTEPQRTSPVRWVS